MLPTSPPYRVAVHPVEVPHSIVERSSVLHRRMGLGEWVFDQETVDARVPWACNEVPRLNSGYDTRRKVIIPAKSRAFANAHVQLAEAGESISTKSSRAYGHFDGPRSSFKYMLLHVTGVRTRSSSTGDPWNGHRVSRRLPPGCTVACLVLCGRGGLGPVQRKVRNRKNRIGVVVLGGCLRAPAVAVS